MFFPGRMFCVSHMFVIHTYKIESVFSHEMSEGPMAFIGICVETVIRCFSKKAEHNVIFVFGWTDVVSRGDFDSASLI